MSSPGLLAAKTNLALCFLAGEMVPMGSFKVHFAFQIEFVLLMTLPEIQRVLAGHPQQIQLHLEAARCVSFSLSDPLSFSNDDV